MTRHKRSGIIMALVLSVALALLTSCVRYVDGMESPSSTPKSGNNPDYHLVIENRSFVEVRIAIGRINDDFFFAEMFDPGEKMSVWHEKIGRGSFIFCWQGVKDMQPRCMQFYIEDDDLDFLLDDDVDLWIEDATSRGCLNESEESKGT